ncbi:MAG: hypothetical protein ACRDQU_06335 [Pseudonocardiaceae bacterium]
MSTVNGYSSGGPEAVVGARPVVLLRYRPGVAGETTRVVHLVPSPLGARETCAAEVALCGASLCLDQMEAITPGEGVPCSLCLISHVSAGPPPAELPAPAPPADITSSDGRPLAAALGYRVWGWPVTLRGDQVWLSLEPDTVALIVPVLLAAQVTAILHQRRCPPLVLVHPDTPEHRVLLAGQPYGVGLPWPSGVRRVGGAVSLPPTKTARGPVTWVYPPEADALRLCREVDVFGALRTALRGPPR